MENNEILEEILGRGTKNEEMKEKIFEVSQPENPFDKCGKVPYFFKEEYTDETDAFSKYYQAIKKNGYLMYIIEEVENMGEYCDLFSDVENDFSELLLNSYCESIPVNERNENILYASRDLTLTDTPTRGRCLIANRDISKNKILIHEYPTILQVKPLCNCVGNAKTSLYRCHNCGIACKFFYTCDGCNICIFCSRACLLSATKNFHRYECYGLQRHFWSMNHNDYSYLSMRMMLYGMTKKFENELIIGSGYGSYKNNYPFIYILESNFEQMSWAKVNEILYSSMRNLIYLIRKTTFFYQFEAIFQEMDDLYLYLGGLMVKHYCQAQANNVLLNYANLPAGFGLNIISGSGKAICPTIALLNHSCAPNAAIVIYGEAIVVKSLRQIQKEEEITICYSEVDALMNVTERQIITEELFYFICTCYFCHYGRTWLKTPYRCRECSGKAMIVNRQDKKRLGYCIHCQYFDATHLDENTKIAQICTRLYFATGELKHYTRLAECYSMLFPIDSWYLYDVYKNLYQKYLIPKEHPLEAIKYGLLTFNLLERHLSRLYLPLLIAKITFIKSILDMDSFIKLQNISREEYSTLSIFYQEVQKIKEDLRFYLTDDRICCFHYPLLMKVSQVVNTVHFRDKEIYGI